jgi:hypothetical protein
MGTMGVTGTTGVMAAGNAARILPLLFACPVQTGHALFLDNANRAPGASRAVRVCTAAGRRSACAEGSYGVCSDADEPESGQSRA